MNDMTLNDDVNLTKLVMMLKSTHNYLTGENLDLVCIDFTFVNGRGEEKQINVGARKSTV